MQKQHYIDKIKVINNLMGINNLITKAVEDENLTNEEYNEVYELASFKAKLIA